MKLEDITWQKSEKINLKQNTPDIAHYQLDSELSDCNSDWISKIQKAIDLTQNNDSIVRSDSKYVCDTISLTNKKTSHINMLTQRSYMSRIIGSRYLTDEDTIYSRYKLLWKIWLCGITLLLALFLIKILVIAYVESGYKRLLEVRQEAWNIELMQQNLNDARFDFIMADILYYPLSWIPHRDIKNGYHIIQWWKNLTELWDDIFSLYQWINDLAQDKWIENISYTRLLQNISGEFVATQDKLEKAIYHYNSVQWLSDSYLEYKLTQATQALDEVLTFNASLNENYDSLLSLLWSKQERKYLIVFQNADEIRPMGGFMWSMWIVTIKNGTLIDFDKRDVYNYEWNLKTADYERELAPKWLDQITTYLWLRDSNYLINMKDSSQQIKFFINQAWFEIDGIVYVNQNTIIDMLEATGGVELDYLDRPITARNFSVFMSSIVEAKLTKQWTLWTPKQVLFDFIDAYVWDIKANKAYPDIANVMVDHLMRREIGFYSFIEEENRLLSDLSLNFNIDYSQTLDFAYPVYTSIGGNKSDRYMQREYNKTIQVNQDCSIDTSLTLTLKHLMTKNRLDEVYDIIDAYDIENRETQARIQWKSPNKSYIRILLPKDAVIQKNSKISIIEHPSVQEVNFFMTTQRLETRDFNIYYSLANPDCQDYDFMLYHQPGITDHTITLSDGNNSIQKSWVKKDFYYSVDD